VEFLNPIRFFICTSGPSEPDHPLLVQILDLHATLIKDGKDIIFVWIPDHFDLVGNSTADRAASEARGGCILDESMPFSDFKPFISKYLQGKWQTQWDALPSSKLRDVVPLLSEAVPRCRTSRREETVLARLHIGHTYVTHSHLLKREDPPFCVACDEIFTVEHFLLCCADLIEIRHKHFTAESLKVLFRDVLLDKIFFS